MSQPTNQTTNLRRFTCHSCSGPFLSSVWRLRCPSCIRECVEAMRATVWEEDD